MASNSTVTPVGNDNSTPNSSKSLSPVFCLSIFVGNSACGALMGSIFGYGAAGLVKKKGFKQSFVEAGSTAKKFAILSGVDTLVGCILTILGVKDDVINAGISGCCSGLAMSYPDSEALRSFEKHISEVLNFGIKSSEKSNPEAPLK